MQKKQVINYMLWLGFQNIWLKTIMNAFFSSQFAYCPLVWLFHNRTLNNVSFFFKRASSKRTFFYIIETFRGYLSEAAAQRCSLEKVFWKYAANLQENIHAKVWSQWSIIEITLRHGCTPVNLLHIFREPFPENISRQLPLPIDRLTLFFI